MERVIDVTAARRRFGTLLDEVFHKGDVFTIERKGKALARIVPIVESDPLEDDAISIQQKALLDGLNSLPNISIDQDPVQILRSMRKKRRLEAAAKYAK